MRCNSKKKYHNTFFPSIRNSMTCYEIKNNSMTILLVRKDKKRQTDLTTA